VSPGFVHHFLYNAQNLGAKYKFLLIIKKQKMKYENYKKCIDACLACAALCNNCASSCLKEEDVKMMASCIQLDMECAALCYASAQLMSLGSTNAMELCKLCAEACEACADECSKHNNEHCKVCAAACRKCADACKNMM
jgi:hypothetical protein